MLDRDQLRASMFVKLINKNCRADVIEGVIRSDSLINERQRILWIDTGYGYERLIWPNVNFELGVIDDD